MAGLSAAFCVFAFSLRVGLWFCFVVVSVCRGFCLTLLGRGLASVPLAVSPPLLTAASFLHPHLFAKVFSPSAALSTL